MRDWFHFGLMVVGTFLLLWAEEGFGAACSLIRLAVAEGGFDA